MCQMLGTACGRRAPRARAAAGMLWGRAAARERGLPAAPGIIRIEYAQHVGAAPSKAVGIAICRVGFSS